MKASFTYGEYNTHFRREGCSKTLQKKNKKQTENDF